MYFVKTRYGDVEYESRCDAAGYAFDQLSEDEQRTIVDAYEEYAPDDIEDHYFFEDWLAENWKTYLSDYMNEVVEDENNFVMGIPSYAICYLYYGDTDNLTDEDIQNIDEWVEKMEKANNGRGFDVNAISGRDEYFDPNPCFGLPCNVEDCWIIYH